MGSPLFTEAAATPFQVGDRVMVSGLDDEMHAGTVDEFETFEHTPHEPTMWVRLDNPYEYQDRWHRLGSVWVSADHTSVVGPVSLGARVELIKTEPEAEDDYFDETPCKCGGAWHAVGDHCRAWTCPGCDYDADCPIYGDLAGDSTTGRTA